MRAWCVVLILAACGGESAPLTPDAAPPCFEYPGTKRLRIKVERFGSMGIGSFPGTVCVDGRPDLPCPVPDTNSLLGICVPDSGDFALRLQHADYATIQFLFGQEMLQLNTLITTGNTTFVKGKFYEPISKPYPPTANGNIVMNLWYVTTPGAPGSPLSGATVELTPNAQVVYADEMQDPDTTITASTNGGLVMVPDVPAGMYDVKITSQAAPNCYSDLGKGWTSPVAGQTLRVPVVAGRDTAVVVACTP